jgi:choline dehydrogenase-like flavoprotein
MLCDTFVPSIEIDDDPHGFWARAASHLAVPEAIEQALAELPPKQVEGLGELLDALAAQGLNGAPQDAREAIVHGFADSGPEALAGIHSLKGLTMMLHYALPDLGTGRNPNWEAIGYPGPPVAPRQVPRELRIRRPETDELTIEADVCVVGSGAGGGVIAGELAGRGKRVCVLEMGAYLDESDFTGLEIPAYQSLYLNGGPFPTAEGQVSIQAGSSLGGGTTINWTNSLRTHPWVREQWSREHGLEGLDGAEFDRHLDAVLERLGVTEECSDLNGNHRRLQEGCEALGYDFRLTRRNTDPATYDPEAAGFMGFGDVSGSKRSTAKTYLADAQASGAELVADSRAERIVAERGRAAGVEAAYQGPDGTTARVVVRAPRVVVACGSIESPALLVRSGIGGSAVGRHLHLHPTSAISGHYDEEQRVWWGPPQAALSHQFADLEDGYGFLIECPHHTTGLAAAAGAWESGRRHKEFMLEWGRSATFINLTRDRGYGRVTVDATGTAVPEYRLVDEMDVRHFRRGLVEMIRLHEAAGARRIVTLARKPTYWERGEDLEAFIAKVTEGSLAPREHGIFSAHQMGTCRMGTDPEASVAGPWGELHDTEGVWIGDASAFPTSSGTNPMITIMALARRTAEAIAAE